MVDRKAAREAGHYQPSAAEVEHGRASADAEHRERRRAAEAWCREHRDDLAKIETLVDRDLARLGGSDAMKSEIRKSMILSEVMRRVNTQPALAAAV